MGACEGALPVGSEGGWPGGACRSTEALKAGLSPIRRGDPSGPRLGIDIGQASVSNYMPQHRKPPSRGWRTFLKNRATETAEYCYETSWDGRDAQGKEVRRGVYFLRLEQPPMRAVRRLVVLR